MGDILNVKAMDVPRTRKEIEHRMNLLEVATRNEKMIVDSNCIGVINSLSKVRRMQNGRLDLLTVDETSRLQANMMENFPFSDNL